ncbi:hypothetical protein D3C73_1316980 [compost metagenome]
MHQRENILFCTIGNIESPDALRTIKFMRRKHKKINSKITEINSHFTDCLGGITQDEHVMLMGNFAYLFYGQNNTCFIIRQHGTNQHRILPDNAGQCIQIQHSLLIHLKVRDFKSQPLHKNASLQYGFMLGDNTNNMFLDRKLKSLNR